MDMNNDYTHSDRTFLLETARNSITCYLNHGKLQIKDHDRKLDEVRGVFVTLHSGSDLRGCIGYPLPVNPLIDAVAENALSAAFRDPRFHPVTMDELEKIDIEISVLTIPRKISSSKDVVIGRDGIIISRGSAKGLLLPQVPVEQNWDLNTYLEWGCRKAGLPGHQWKHDAEIEIFQAEVFGEKEL